MPGTACSLGTPWEQASSGGSCIMSYIIAILLQCYVTGGWRSLNQMLIHLESNLSCEFRLTEQQREKQMCCSECHIVLNSKTIVYFSQDLCAVIL